LICNATNDVDAINPLSIDWYNFKRIKLEADDRHVLVYNTTDTVTGQVQSMLLFDPVNHTDSGEYTCRALNDDDCYTEDKTNLTVECECSVNHNKTAVIILIRCTDYFNFSTITPQS